MQLLLYISYEQSDLCAHHYNKLLVKTLSVNPKVSMVPLYYVQKALQFVCKQVRYGFTKIPHVFPMKSFLVFEGLHADV